MSRYRIQIDRSLCSGFGSCVDAAPDAFELDGGGIAVIREGGLDDRAVEATRACPMGAISIADPETGERIA